MRRVRGRLKSPDPEKESRWQQELPHSWTAPVPPTTHPSSLGSYSTSVQKALWGGGALKWKNVSMLGLSTQHQITRSLLTPVQHFTNTLSQTNYLGSWPCSAPSLLCTKRLTDGERKNTRHGEEGQKEEDNNDNNKLEINISGMSRGF